MNIDENIILIFVIFLTALFAYSNGFQDGSTVSASVIGSRTLTPKHAVLLVCLFELLGTLLGGSAVAGSIKALAKFPETPDLLALIACAMSAAISWNFCTKQVGLPSSSAHALVGGLLGALIAAGGGVSMINWGSFNHCYDATGVAKVILSLFAAPLIGFGIGFLLLKIMMVLLIKASTRVNFYLKLGQIPALAAVAFGHGANDTQKVMGVVLLSLNAFIPGTNSIPLWVRVLTAMAMVLGIASLAPKIVKRVGTDIFRMRPIHGFVTQTAAAFVLCASSYTGCPVSASQIITSTVIGVGTAERQKGVQWLVARDMVVAWFVTIPGAALGSALMYLLLFHELTNFL